MTTVYFVEDIAGKSNGENDVHSMVQIYRKFCPSGYSAESPAQFTTCLNATIWTDTARNISSLSFGPTVLLLT